MDVFQADLQKFLSEWDAGVWVSTLNKNTRVATLKRTDEYPMTLEVHFSIDYPRGATTIFSNGKQYRTKPNETISSAVDEALLLWNEHDEVSPKTAAATSESDDEHSSTESELLEWQSAVSNYRDDIQFSVSFDQTFQRFVVVLTMSLSQVRRLSNFLMIVPSSEELFRRYVIGAQKATTLQITVHMPPRACEDAFPQLRKVEQLSIQEDASVSQQPVNVRYVFVLKRMLEENLRNLSRSGHSIVDKLEVILDTFYFTFEECTTRCMVCWDLLNSSSMRITHCDREPCTFAVEQLGVGVSVVSELKEHPEVFEVLIALSCASACTSDKRDTFQPMCPVSVEHLRSSLNFVGPSSFFTENKEKNFSFLVQLIQQIPSVTKLLELSEGDESVLRRTLNRMVHPLAYPLLQWIVSSNRSLLKFIPPAHQVKALGSKQFLLLSSHPQRERKFRLWRTEMERLHGEGNGSFFAWHGSAIGNWHAILRDGLKLLSGTKWMTNGQVYGAGIYFAHSILTSLSYAGSPEGAWKGSSLLSHPSGCTVLALCEIIADSDVFKNHQNDIITVQNPDAICTRFLFLFPGGVTTLQALPPNKEIAMTLFEAFPDFLYR